MGVEAKATMNHATIFALIVGVALLTAAAPSQAIYIETDLLIDPPDSEADKGDNVTFTIKPNPNVEDAKQKWGGQTAKLRFSYDKNETPNAGPDEATSDEGYTTRDIAEIVLDDEARGEYTWTVPQEVDDRNVAVFLEAADGERLAFGYLNIGDAEPMMRIASSGPGDAEPEPAPGNGEEAAEDEAQEQEEASAFGLVALTLAISAVVAAVAVRRHG